MLTSREIALATTLALTVAHDIKFRIRVHKTALKFLAASESWEEEMAISDAKIEYLLHICEKNNVQADEFDLIALHDLYNQ